MTPAEVERSARFRRDVEHLAARHGASVEEILRETHGYVAGLCTAHVPSLYRLVVRSARALCRAAHDRIDCEPDQIERVRALLEHQPCVVVSRQRSALDGAALTVAFHDHGLPDPVAVGTDDAGSWLIRRLWRRANGVVVRRDETPIYAYAVGQCLGHLVERGMPLRVVEGARPPTGKLGGSRPGFLSHVVDAYRAGHCDDVWLLPVDVSYERQPEASAFAASGTARGAFAGLVPDWSLRDWSMKDWSMKDWLRRRAREGAIYVRFGEPVSLRDMLGRRDALPSPDAPGMSAALNGLALEAASRVAAVAPITGTALVSLALLCARGRAVDAAELHGIVRRLLEFARARSLPMAESAALDEPADCQAVIDALLGCGAAERVKPPRGAADGGAPAAPRYAVARSRALQAAYYRNTIAHWFLPAAAAELAALSAADAPARERLTALCERALAVRDALRHEAVLPGPDAFSMAVLAELERMSPQWHAELRAGPDGVARLLAGAPVLYADVLLRPIFESCLRVASELAGADEAAISESALLARAARAPRRVAGEGSPRVLEPEATARAQLQTAVALAREDGLLDAGEGVGTRRQIWVASLRAALRHLDTVQGIASRG